MAVGNTGSNGSDEITQGVPSFEKKTTPDPSPVGGAVLGFNTAITGTLTTSDTGTIGSENIENTIRDLIESLEKGLNIKKEELLKLSWGERDQPEGRLEAIGNQLTIFNQQGYTVSALLLVIGGIIEKIHPYSFLGGITRYQIDMIYDLLDTAEHLGCNMGDLQEDFNIKIGRLLERSFSDCERGLIRDDMIKDSGYILKRMQGTGFDISFLQEQFDLIPLMVVSANVTELKNHPSLSVKDSVSIQNQINAAKEAGHGVSHLQAQFDAAKATYLLTENAARRSMYSLINSFASMSLSKLEKALDGFELKEGMNKLTNNKDLQAKLDQVLPGYLFKIAEGKIVHLETNPNNVSREKIKDAHMSIQKAKEIHPDTLDLEARFDILKASLRHTDIEELIAGYMSEPDNSDELVKGLVDLPERIRAIKAEGYDLASLQQSYDLLGAMFLRSLDKYNITGEITEYSREFAVKSNDFYQKITSYLKKLPSNYNISEIQKLQSKIDSKRILNGAMYYIYISLPEKLLSGFIAIEKLDIDNFFSEIESMLQKIDVLGFDSTDALRSQFDIGKKRLIEKFLDAKIYNIGGLYITEKDADIQIVFDKVRKYGINTTAWEEEYTKKRSAQIMKTAEHMVNYPRKNGIPPAYSDTEIQSMLNTAKALGHDIMALQSHFNANKVSQ